MSWWQIVAIAYVAALVGFVFGWVMCAMVTVGADADREEQQ